MIDPPACFHSASSADIIDGVGENPRPCILIVDDVPANLGVLLDVLGGANYKVLVAESGESALRQLDFAQPDLVLLDVMMPGIDGYETCRQIKISASGLNTPVLFLSALDDPVDKVRAFEVGAVDFITKPLHSQEVLARVRAHLQIRSLQGALADQNTLLKRAIALRLEAEHQLQQSLDCAVLIVANHDQVHFCTRMARRLVERYFPDDPAETADGGNGRLPAPLANWAAQCRGGTIPWKGTTQGAWLEARLFTEGQSGGGFMLLLEERIEQGVTGLPVLLLRLGLTGREAEVLYWIAHGKTSPEIALILDAALNTIKKHVQNILLKLGVETRLAAALRAAEILGLTYGDNGSPVEE